MSDSENSGYDCSSNEEFAAIKQRFGYACILCGYSNTVDVVQILAKNRVEELRLLREWSVQLIWFEQDQFENLICFCPNHRWEYINGLFTIVPSPNVRKKMREQEIKNFKLRQQVVNSGFPDPGRTLLMPPQLPYEFEYVPVAGRNLLQVHNKTPSLPETFCFRSQEMEKYPLRRWEIPVYAVLMAAYQPLNNPARIRSARSDAACSEVVELVDLYRRGRITPTPCLPNPLSDQKITQYQTVLATSQTVYPARDPIVRAQESPDEAVGQGSSLNHPTDRINDFWREEDTMDTTNTAKADFPDSDDDPVVTPAVLSHRLKWRHTGFSSMRFATSSDFVVDPDEPQV